MGEASPRRLDAEGLLAITDPEGRALRVTALGRRVAVELPSLWMRHALPGPVARRSTRAWLLENIQAFLRRADLVLEIRVAGRVVAELTPNSRPGLLSEVLGIGPMRVHPRAVLAALLRGGR